MLDRLVRASLVVACIFGVSLPLALAAPESSTVALAIDKAWAKVGGTHVWLELTDAQLSDEGLQATYRLRSRFIDTKWDAEPLTLRAPESTELLLQSGGKLMGSARSAVTGKKHVVHCTMRVDGTMRIDLRMGRRIMTFRTRYRVDPEE